MRVCAPAALVLGSCAWTGADGPQLQGTEGFAYSVQHKMGEPLSLGSVTLCVDTDEDAADEEVRVTAVRPATADSGLEIDAAAVRTHTVSGDGIEFLGAEPATLADLGWDTERRIVASVCRESGGETTVSELGFEVRRVTDGTAVTEGIVVEYAYGGAEGASELLVPFTVTLCPPVDGAVFTGCSSLDRPTSAE